MEITVYTAAVTFFLVTNPLGNAPAILSFLKDFDFDRQRAIILREALIGLGIAIFFQFFGEYFLGMLQLNDYAVSITGGILLLLVSLEMIFPHPQQIESTTLKQEPFIVPIATPLLSGPGLLTMVMLYTKKASNPLIVTGGICLAWIAITAILAAAPYLQRALGKRGMGALEQLMGLILAMIGIQLIEKGIELFLETFV